MSRRGQEFSLSTVIIIVLLLLVLAFFIFRTGAVQKMLGRAVEDSTQCPKSDPAFSCLPAGQGCGTGLQTISKLCGTGQVCCYDPTKATSTPGAVNPNTPTDPNRIAPVTFVATDAVTRRPVAEYGTTVVTVGTEPKVIDLGVTLPACNGCRWTVEEIHTTRSGYRISEQSKNYGEVSEADLRRMLDNELKSVQLVNDPKYIGETITYTLLLTPMVNRTSGTTHRFTFNYRVTSPVTVTPLSTDWQRSKTVVASCPDSSRPCSMIYYTIQTEPEECKTLVDVSNAQEIPVRYCLTKDKKVERCEFQTLQQCQVAVDGGGAEQSQVIQIITTAAQQGVLGDSQILQYAAWEQETSPYSCQLDVNVDLGGTYLTRENKIVPITANTTFNTERQQATIYLDKNFMTDRYLCVYGQDLRDKSKIYTAGRPQRITIDTVPPVAQIRFEPLTLRITFTCEDDRSGCKQAYWVQYISDITRFMPALISGGGQSAAIWCPPAQTSSGWRMETKSQVPYTSNEVRVLCLRVEDNAGNAGVTKAVLYNGYQMLQAVIVEAAK